MVLHMALHKYFKKAPSALRNPNGPLSDCMPSRAISSANREVSSLVCQDTAKIATHGKYTSYSAEKLIVAKRAAEFGVTSTLRF